VAAERSLVRYDGRRETIVMRLTLAGQGRRAAWIMPSPALPVLALGQPRVFSDLDALTAPRRVVHHELRLWRGGGGGLGGAGRPLPGSGSAPAVRVLRQQTFSTRLGELRAVVLRSASLAPLRAWLSSHGFAVGPAVVSRLGPYLHENWFLALAQLQPRHAARLEGELEPLSISFATPALIYPMRLSAAGTITQSLTLDVLAPYRVIPRDSGGVDFHSTGKQVAFAGEIGASDLHRSSAGHGAVSPGASPLEPLLASRQRTVLTSLRASVYPRRITGDITLERDTDQRPYRAEEVTTKGTYIFPDLLALAVAITAVLLLAAYLLVVARRRWRRRGSVSPV